MIRSENAAKPVVQPSKYLLGLLDRYSPMRDALDFGCGKLRYAVHLARLAENLTLVDSEIQLCRIQVVDGKPTTIRDFAKVRWQHATVLNAEEFRRCRQRFDFALCANVLSTIPRVSVRKTVIGQIGQRLKSRGCCLFVCQYTNSYFREQMAAPNVTKYGDGFIKGTKQNASFYGLINPTALVKLVTSTGMAVVESWRHDQSGYVLARRK